MTHGGGPDCAPMRNNLDVSERIGALLVCTKLMLVLVKWWLISLLQMYNSGRLSSTARCSCLPFSWKTGMATQGEWSTGFRAAPVRFPPTCSIMTSALFHTASACLCCAPPGACLFACKEHARTRADSGVQHVRHWTCQASTGAFRRCLQGDCDVSRQLRDVALRQHGSNLSPLLCLHFVHTNRLRIVC